MRVALLGAAFGAMMAAPMAGAASPAGAGGPRLFYTTNSPPQLKVVDYRITDDVLSVGPARVVANLAHADGLAVAPDGDLLVGGAATGKIYKVNPQSGRVAEVGSGIAMAFHVTVSPDGATAWTAGLPGSVARVPLRPFGPGSPARIQGDDRVLTTIGFTPGATFYTSSDSFGSSGNFGTLDVVTLTTKRVSAGLRGAHGFAYDPFTKNIFLLGSFAIVQIDPLHPDVVLSQRVVPDMAFDQGVADGHGHLLAASNTGYLHFFDYSATGTIGAKDTAASRVFLDNNLDDIAPQQSVGPQVAAPRPAGSVFGGRNRTVLILGPFLAALGLVALRRRRHAPDDRHRPQTGRRRGRRGR